ncbi:MAG TPA: cyclic pyranopterin monophosphate synthase MoaC [Thermaerobacter sp.]
MDTGVTHLDEAGRARMVDVSGKPATVREAVARGRVRMAPETVRRLRTGGVPKGDVWAVARVAGIMAAKETGRLIPLCHPLPVDAVEVDFRLGEDAVEIQAVARTAARTGVEMEALTAVTVAALTIVDMCKALDRTLVIEGVRLVAKRGGRSGEFRRPGEPAWDDLGSPPGLGGGDRQDPGGAAAGVTAATGAAGGGTGEEGRGGPCASPS